MAAASDTDTELSEGYDYDFVSPLRKEHVCPICLLALKRPVLTKCGHRFCGRCLTKANQSQRISGTKCPIDNEYLDLKMDIFPDRATERLVRSLLVTCSREECRWTGELRCMATDHLRTCAHRVVRCPNESCEVQLVRKKLKGHVENECEWRMVECDFCDQQIAVGKKEDHHEVCGRCPVSCFLCGSIIPREEEKEHLDSECPLIMVSCDYKHLGCNKQLERRDLHKHLDVCTKEHLRLSCDRLVEVQRRCDVLENTLNQTRRALTRATSTKFVWRITNFEELFEKRENGSNIKSEIFYSDNYGYKMRLQLYPNGSGPGLATHVSVFLTLMRGEYDGILDWPFQSRVKLTLYDQQENSDEKENIVSCFIPDGTERSFRKPTSVVNVGRGYPKFISHERLKSRKYVADDSLFLSVEIEPRTR